MAKSTEFWLKLAVILAGIYLLSQVTSIYLPVILSIILTFILNPLVNVLSRQQLWPLRRDLGRGPAVFFAFCLTLLIIAIVLSFILAPFFNEFNKLVNNLPYLMKQIQTLTIEVQKQINYIAIAGHLPTAVEQAMSSAAAYSLGLVRRIVNSIFNLASGIIELIIVPVLTYYLLKDWQLIKENVILLFSPRTRGKAGLIIDEMGTAVSGYIRGQFIVSIIVGLLVFGGMYGFGVEYPLVLGLLATITETIPIIGPIIGAVPAVVLAYLAAPALAVKVIIFYLVVQQFENQIIVPKIMGHVIDLHPIAVIISLLIGGQLFGVAGMMLAVPVAAIVKVLLNHLWIKEER